MLSDPWHVLGTKTGKLVSTTHGIDKKKKLDANINLAYTSAS
jgi:hypothetical protein